MRDAPAPTQPIAAVIPPYAVLFKTHFWDDFAKRQFARLTARVGSGHVYVCIDESNGVRHDIDHDRVMRIKQDDLLSLGLPDVRTHGSLLWYSIDYLHCYFFTQHPDYAYYVTVEYDVVINHDFDDLVAKAQRDGMDFVGFPMRTPVSAWPWTPAHRPVYGERLLAYLSCAAVFSQAAMKLLLNRRLEMARQFEAGEVKFWPYTEAFIPTELDLAGLRIGSLAAYGETNAYDWWPPVAEADLDGLSQEGFIHPVLTGERYTTSVLRHHANVLSYLLPNSALRKKLSRSPDAATGKHFRNELKFRAGKWVKRQMVNLHLRPKWFAGASSPSHTMQTR